MGDYRSLRVWRLSHSLALLVYQATRSFPREELYGLTSQMRRCATSIPSNLAEGCGRDTDREIARYARISLGSASELEYQFQLAHDLGLLTADEHLRLTQRVRKIKPMLAKLAAKLSTDD